MKTVEINHYRKEDVVAELPNMPNGLYVEYHVASSNLPQLWKVEDGKIGWYYNGHLLLSSDPKHVIQTDLWGPIPKW